MSDTPLFREEAIQAKRLAHLGTAGLHLPPRMLASTFILLILVLVCVYYIGNLHYERRLLVLGNIDDDHAFRIAASDIGQLEQLLVEEGQQVSKGQLLGRIVRFSNKNDGHTFIKQQAHWQSLKTLATSQYRTERQRVLNELVQSRRLYRLLLADIELQKTKVAALEQQFARMKLLIGKGYLSRLDWLQFETNLITEKQNLSRHIQNRIQLSNNMGDSRKQLEAIDDGSKQRQQEIDLQLSQLAAQQLQYNRQAYQNLAAPVEGRISHISVSRGAAVMPGESILFISTNIKHYSATLNIPSSAAGFVNVGQSLELEIDAFPAQRFGRVNATITQLTNHTVNSQTRNSKQQSRRFLARLAIDRTSLDQFGEGKVLPGMRFTSHIALDRKTLFMWFAEPLLKLLDRM